MAVSRRRRSMAATLRSAGRCVIPPRGEARSCHGGTTSRRSRGYAGHVTAPSPQSGEPDRAISVLIADDQELVRAGFRAILETQPGISVCGEAADGRAAIQLARMRHPDVVLMDIQMPDVDGLEATRRLLDEQHPDHPVAVLMLTTFDLDAYVYDALRAGASGFLLKD